MAKRGKHLLEDLQLRRMIAAGTKTAVSDGDGLTFTLSAAGTATWILRYRMQGKQHELTVGNYPDITLASARKLCRDYRGAIDRGEHPARDKQRAKVRSSRISTVRELADDYRAKKLADLAPATIEYRESDLDQVIVPKLGALAVTDVRPGDVVAMVQGAKRSWTISKRILTCTKLMFEHALGLHLIQSNPVVGVSLVSLMGKRPPVKRRIMLSEPDLRKLLGNLDVIGTENSLALRIMLATCVRTVELVKAEWQYVDLDKGEWLVMADTVKTRQGFVVPLTPTVVDWFRQLKELAGASRWVLPARTEARNQKFDGDAHVGLSTLSAAIRRAFARNDLDVRKFTPHDTRSTAKGHMRNLGVSREASELALNHKLRGMEGIYDVRDDFPERRAAIELWAKFIAACESGTDWNVTPIRRDSAA